jgi:hypothetical protein
VWSDLLETVPILKNYNMVEAYTSNKTTKEGSVGQLVLRLEQAGKKALVDVYSYEGKTWVAVYGL